MAAISKMVSWNSLKIHDEFMYHVSLIIKVIPINGAQMRGA